MKSSIAVLVWLIGFVIIFFLLNEAHLTSPTSTLSGFFCGMCWTSLIISLTKKTDGKDSKQKS